LARAASSETLRAEFARELIEPRFGRAEYKIPRAGVAHNRSAETLFELV
jgi:hypothetical protein